MTPKRTTCIRFRKIGLFPIERQAVKVCLAEMLCRHNTYFFRNPDSTQHPFGARLGYRGTTVTTHFRQLGRLWHASAVKSEEPSASVKAALLN